MAAVFCFPSYSWRWWRHMKTLTILLLWPTMLLYLPFTLPCKCSELWWSVRRSSQLPRPCGDYQKNTGWGSLILWLSGYNWSGLQAKSPLCAHTHSQSSCTPRDSSTASTLSTYTVASPAGPALARPLSWLFSHWSRPQTAETVWGQDQPADQEPGAAQPDCIGVAKNTLCVYDEQLHYGAFRCLQ